MPRVLVAALSTVLLLASHAHAQETRKMEFLLGARQNELNVSVEYEDPSVIDPSLKGSRVLPVRLVLRNISQRPLTFDYGDVRLNLNGEDRLTPVDAATVEREIRRTGRFPKLLGFLSSQSSTFHRSGVEKLRLRDGSIRPGQSKDGFIFFMRPETREPAAFNGVMALETTRYQPQMLETKDVIVKTRTPKDVSLLERVAQIGREQLLGEKPSFNKSYALLIGIGKYRHLNPLSSPAQDVAKMADFLHSQGFDEVIAARDETVTLQMLKTPQRYFKNKIQADDRFLFYYSGHGISRTEAGRIRGYLPLYNEQKGNFSNSIAMDSLVAWMKGMNPIHLLVILDSCFSGLAVEGTELKGNDSAGANINRETLDLLSRGPARYLLMAGTEDQEAFGDRQWNGSLFTDALIRGLRNAKDVDMHGDRIITTRELYPWLKQTVSLEARRVRRELTPLLKDLGPNGVSKGDFVFVRN